MRYEFIRRSIATFGAAAVVLGAVGCSGAVPVQTGAPGTCSDDVARSPATVVLTATATSAEPAVALPPDLRDELRASARQGKDTCVAVVTPQGELDALDVTPRRTNGEVENGPGRDRKVEQNLDAVAGRLAALAQTRPGLDPLGMIDLAVRRHPSPGTLIVVTSGVSTVSPVDLRTLGWDLDPGAQAGALVKTGAVPPLTGWKVRFIGLGDVAGKQAPLPLALRRGLQLWWTALCRQAGATSCDAESELIADAPPVSRNAVPIVAPPRPVVSRQRINLPAALMFTEDSAVLQPDPGGGLESVVQRARRTGEFIQIVGHTDAITGSAGHNRDLSQRRADAVYRQLLKLGLPPAQLIQAIGVGAADASIARERSDPDQVSLDRNVEISFQPGPGLTMGAPR